MNITIPDDIAISLMNQIARALSQAAQQPVDGNIRSRLIEYLQEQPRGTVITHGGLKERFNCSTSHVSNALLQAKKIGFVEMTKRGLWQRI